MTDTLFTAANLLVLPAWALLMLAPGHRLTNIIVHRGLIPALLALAYAVLLGAGMGDAPADFTTLQGLRDMFGSDTLMLAGWLHYLTFDLLIGSKVARTAHAKGYSKVWVVPVLLLTFMLGPLGWLVFTGIDLANSADPA